MDAQSPRENDSILHAFIEQEDPHVVALVGMDALMVLANELPTEKFKQFLQQSIQDSAQVKQNVQPAGAAATTSTSTTPPEPGTQP